MAAMDFPNTPTVGQIYSTTDRSWIWTGSRWDAYGSPRTQITASDDPPASPSPNQLWFESDTGKTFIWYDNFWVDITAPPSSTAAGTLTGDTMAANVTKYPPHMVLAPPGDTHEGGQVDLQGAIGWPGSVFIDRYDNALRVYALNRVALGVADTRLDMNPSDRAYLNGRPVMLPVAYGRHTISANVGPIGSGIGFVQSPGNCLRLTGLKAGDVIRTDIDAVINVNGAGAFANIGCQIYAGAYVGEAIPQAMMVAQHTAGIYTTAHFSGYYALGSAGDFDFTSTLQCNFGGSVTAVANYWTLSAMAFGIR